MRFPTDLTLREEEILRLVAIGLPNAAIAKRLWVVDQTVKHHVGNILRKLGVENRGAAVWRALELGLIEAPGASPSPPVCPTCGRPLQ